MKRRLPWATAILAAAAFAACDESGTVARISPAAVGACGELGAPVSTPDPSACREQPFEDVTAAWGIDVVHQSAGDCVPQVIGPGGCLIDYDADCDLDLVLFPGVGSGAELLANTGGHFAPVPGAAGLAGGYNGLGCLAFDYDGDGDVDLFFTTTEGQLLYRNEAGTFTDATTDAGLEYPQSGTSATAGDIDGDGDLDLFVLGFVDGGRCAGPCESRPNTCLPQADRLWENVGGRFVEATAAHGIVTNHTALAARFFDFDRDGDLDLWIGSDLGNDAPYYPIQLWVNDGTGHFVEQAAQRGLALAANGHSGDVMGVDIVDFNLDGTPDVIASTNLHQPLLFFECAAGGQCADRSAAVGLASSSALFKWAVVLEDLDRDGWPDALVADGDVDETPLDELPALFWNDAGKFTPYVAGSGDPLAVAADRRAILQGDLDGDGLLDAILTSYGGPVTALRSRQACGHGLRVLVDGGQAVGARVRVEAGGLTLERQVSASASYLGSASPDLFFGLGQALQVNVTVQWLDGAVVRFAVPADSHLAVTHP